MPGYPSLLVQFDFIGQLPDITFLLGFVRHFAAEDLLADLNDHFTNLVLDIGQGGHFLVLNGSMSIADDLGSLLFGFIMASLIILSRISFASFSMAALSSRAEASKASFSLFSWAISSFTFPLLPEIWQYCFHGHSILSGSDPRRIFQDEQYDQEGQNRPDNQT